MHGKLKWAGRVVLTVVTMVLAVASGACANVIYVDDDAPAGGDGSSWATAYRSLQDALTEAAATEEPVEIRVARGTYRPDRDAAHPNGTGDRKASFELLSGLTLAGGYAGVGASDPNVRDTEIHRSVLSGDLDDDDTYVDDATRLSSDANRYENSHHVVAGENVDGTAVLEGFVISGGFSVGVVPHGVGYDGGAGVYSSFASPTVIDCTFISNATVSGWGGAMLNANNSSPTVIRCKFVCNRADGGGAVCNTQNSNPSFADCVFIRNSADHGAAVYNNDSSPRLANCRFRANHAEPFAGAMYNRDTTLFLSACIFEENEACGNMSSMARGGAIVSSRGRFEAEGCLFRRNLAERGGAICSDGTVLTLTSCEFLANSARRNGSTLTQTDGGAIWSTHGKVLLVRCRFSGNSTGWSGGALSIGFCTGELRNCILAGNSAARWGGGILSNDNHWILYNCTFVANRAKRGPALDDYFGTSVITGSVYREHAMSPISGSASVRYSNIAGGWPGEGNIDADPCFVDPGYWDANGTPDDPNDDFFVAGDYHLKSQAGRWDPVSESWVQDDVTSPCIDAGDPNSPVGYEPFPNGGCINMGAYGGTAEASKSYFGQPLCETPIAGDINGDCRVDYRDVGIMLRHWLEGAKP